MKTFYTMLCIACPRYITKYSFGYSDFVSVISKGGLALLTKLTSNLTEDSLELMFMEKIPFHVAPFCGFVCQCLRIKFLFLSLCSPAGSNAYTEMITALSPRRRCPAPRQYLANEGWVLTIGSFISLVKEVTRISVAANRVRCCVFSLATEPYGPVYIKQYQI